VLRRLILLVGAAAVGLAVRAVAPDVARYLKMREM
jgi:hypothetical protein